jgi:hypothetical protein
MTIKVSCSCGQMISAKDELEGQTLLCPKCHQPLTIGAAAAAPKGKARDAEDAFEDVGLKEVKGKRCPSCGAGLKPGAVLCVQCGFHLETGGRVSSDLTTRRAKAGSAERMLELAQETIEVEKSEERKMRSQGAPAWVLFAALVIVCGFAASMYLLPRNQAFLYTGWGFIALGGLISFIYSIRLVIVAFQEDMVCGLLYLFLPFYSLYYIATRWAKCGGLMIRAIMGGLVIGLGFGFHAMAPWFSPDTQIPTTAAVRIAPSGTMADAQAAWSDAMG